MSAVSAVTLHFVIGKRPHIGDVATGERLKELPIPLFIDKRMRAVQRPLIAGGHFNLVGREISKKIRIRDQDRTAIGLESPHPCQERVLLRASVVPEWRPVREAACREKRDLRLGVRRVDAIPQRFAKREGARSRR